MRPVCAHRCGSCRVNILEDRDAEPGDRYVAVFTTVSSDDPSAYRAWQLEDLRRALGYAEDAVKHFSVRDALRDRIVIHNAIGDRAA